MDKFIISFTAFESIIKNLVMLEDVKEAILEDYFVNTPNERKTTEILIDNYIKAIEEFLTMAEKTDSNNRELPFICIGCEVQLEDVFSQEDFIVRIVSPYDNNITSNDISFISPFGQNLLLKRVDDILLVNDSIRVKEYRVKSIAAILV